MEVINYLKKIALFYLVLMLGFSTVHAQEYTTDLQKTVVKIKSSSDLQEQFGTGFVFLIKQRQAFVLTANHVVTDNDDFNLDAIFIEFEGDLEQYPAEVYVAYEEIDIAILLLERFPENIGMLKLGNSANALIGDVIYIYGYPGGGNVQRDNGGIKSKTGGNKILLDDIVPLEGNSGGPLLSIESSEVMGIILQKSANLEDQYAIEIDQVKIFLKRDNVFRPLFDGSIICVDQREIEDLLTGYKESFEKGESEKLERVYKEDSVWSGFFRTFDNIKVVDFERTTSEKTSTNAEVVFSFKIEYKEEGHKRKSPLIIRVWTLEKKRNKWVIRSIKKQ